jgi:A/G-specific adenine glycosylase
MSNFAERLIAWQQQHGRHGLPWQNTRDPYRVWLSEIMLQQTQVTTVIPYYVRFLERFPDILALANAPQDDVLVHWAGLGYYTRARNLHAAAKIVAEKYAGQFPNVFEDIIALPGIGRSTAAAISAFAFRQRRAILDGNVKRVLARQYGVEGYPGQAKVEAGMWLLAEELLPEKGIEIYTQSLMDLGATICIRHRPACNDCPVASTCIALSTNRVAELPHRKPAKVSPKKQTRMLIIRDQSTGQIMMERRPSVGIWGGLWSFPELAVDEDIEAFCYHRWQIKIQIEKPYPNLTHVFTHFSLEITPQPLVLIDQSFKVAEEDIAWVVPQQVLQMGIPTPVKKLLSYFFDGPLFALIS